MTSILSIASTTLGEAIRRRVLLVILMIGVLLLTIIPALGILAARAETSTMISTMFFVLRFTSALIAIVLTVYMIPNEIERRTIYSVLAKPIERWEFFLGKFLGGALTVAFMVGLMSLALMLVLVVLAAKPQTNPLEGATQTASGALNFHDWMTRAGTDILLVLRGTIVIYFQLVIVTAIATTLSLFLTPTVNFSVTAFIWIVGSLQWLVAALAHRNEKGLVLTSLLMKGVYNLLPHFHDFNIMGSIVHPEVDIAVNHWQYAGMVSFYGIAYGLFWLLVGMLVFDKKEV